MHWGTMGVCDRWEERRGARPVTRASGSQVAEVEAGEGPAVKVCAC